MRYFILMILLFASTISHGQKLEGVYMGDLIGEQNMLIIEKEKDHYLVTIQSGKNHSIIMIGKKTENKIKFGLPLDSGEELEVVASRKDELLSLVFELEKKTYHVYFEPVRKTSFDSKSISSNHLKDERLIGTWVEKQTFTLEGILDKELDNSSKNYKFTYTNDGRIIPESRVFRDLAKKHGHKFEFSDIPSIYWSTSDHAILYTEIPSISQTMQSTYQISGDSLTITEEKVKRVFVKIK
ncbi:MULTISPECIES: hypothetical protein [Mongoliitalea]|nr:MULTISPECIES: hypothetical protein [Mongoliitalea]UJP66772.1 hypothetical protein IPZ59_09375 [Mongoliitalea daihaiensis]